MVAPAAGAVVLVRFLFSDLSQTKLRPAVVLADVGRGDCILCQITSQPYGDPSAIERSSTALASGSLRVVSCARPTKLFAANQNLITSQVGNPKPDTLRGIAQAVADIVNAGNPRAASAEAVPGDGQEWTALNGKALGIRSSNGRSAWPMTRE